MIKTVLIIGDQHYKPDTSHERATWAGNLIVHRQPDIVINVGDMADMESLSSYDVGKKSFEGRRYQKDCEAVIEAQEMFFKPLKDYNNGRKKKYQPQFELFEGNHDRGRIDRVIENDPKLDGTIGIKDLKYEEFGWTVTPYKKIKNIEGVAVAHYFTSGLMDKPIGGINVARSVLTKMFQSCIFGHTHLRAVAWDNTADGKPLFALNAGCYFEHEEHYVSQRAQNAWWRGLTLLKIEDGVEKGMEFITMDEIKKLYA